jgi:hypothetical protein
MERRRQQMRILDSNSIYQNYPAVLSSVSRSAPSLLLSASGQLAQQQWAVVPAVSSPPAAQSTQKFSQAQQDYAHQMLAHGLASPVGRQLAVRRDSHSGQRGSNYDRGDPLVEQILQECVETKV